VFWSGPNFEGGTKEPLQRDLSRCRAMKLS